MGKPTGFIEYEREVVPYRDPAKRVGDFGEIYTDPPAEHLQTQGARCMDCGVPFCQSESGAPFLYYGLYIALYVFGETGGGDINRLFKCGAFERIRFIEKGECV